MSIQLMAALSASERASNLGACLVLVGTVIALWVAHKNGYFDDNDENQGR